MQSYYSRESPSSSFTAEEKSRLCELAQATLAQLTTEALATTTRGVTTSSSAATRTTTTTTAGISSVVIQSSTTSTSARARFFHATGFCKVDNFCSFDECQQLKDAMARLVETQWHPPDSTCNCGGDDSDDDDGDDGDDDDDDDGVGDTKQGKQKQQRQRQQPLDSFGTDEEQNTARGDYFLDSADQVHFFAEPAALLKDNKQLLLLPAFRGKNNQNKINALNKVGHGLHLLQPSPFYDYTHSAKLQHLVKDELGWTNPVVPQSMYIFKQAVLGGAVNSHQDSTFLFTTPRQSCLGLWLALDDATLDNGCLWVRPKSHLEPVRRHYQRNPLYFQKQQQQQQTEDDNNTTDDNVPKFIMQELETNHNVPWEGSLPDDLIKAGFIPIECKAGDLLAFGGQLDHLSLPNTSDKARHTFQLHLVNVGDTDWSTHNWLQYPDGKDFVAL